MQPAITGVELYRHFIRVGYAIPSILVTAYPDDVDWARTLNDGVVCYHMDVSDQASRFDEAMGCSRPCR